MSAASSRASAHRWRRWLQPAATAVGAATLAAALAWAASPLLPSKYTARASFLPPAQGQSGLAGMVAQLGPLAGLAGAGLRTSADQYVTIMLSQDVLDQIIAKFDLRREYGEPTMDETRAKLQRRVRAGVGKKDGVIFVEVDARQPQLAADIANTLVDSLAGKVARMTLSEAKQRRVYFEGLLQETRGRLLQAQQQLESSGVGSGTLRADVKVAAEGYARASAEVSAAEVRLRMLEQRYAAGAPELEQQKVRLQELRRVLSDMQSRSGPATSSPSYISRLRDYKYQEMLFEMLARQFEVARADEARDSGTLQIIDRATAPDSATFPRPKLIAASVFAAVLVLMLGMPLVRVAAGVRRTHS